MRNFTSASSTNKYTLIEAFFTFHLAKHKRFTVGVCPGEFGNLFRKSVIAAHIAYFSNGMAEVAHVCCYFFQSQCKSKTRLEIHSIGQKLQHCVILHGERCGGRSLVARTGAGITHAARYPNALSKPLTD